MTGVPVRIVLEIVLVLGLRLPKRTRRLYFRYDLSRATGRTPRRRRSCQGRASLLGLEVVDHRAVTGAAVVALAILVVGSWIWKKNAEMSR